MLLLDLQHKLNTPDQPQPAAVAEEAPTELLELTPLVFGVWKIFEILKIYFALKPPKVIFLAAEGGENF